MRMNSPFPFDKVAHDNATVIRVSRIRIFKERAEFMGRVKTGAESMALQNMEAENNTAGNMGADREGLRLFVWRVWMGLEPR